MNFHTDKKAGQAVSKSHGQENKNSVPNKFNEFAMKMNLPIIEPSPVISSTWPQIIPLFNKANSAKSSNEKAESSKITPDEKELTLPAPAAPAFKLKDLKSGNPDKDPAGSASFSTIGDISQLRDDEDDNDDQDDEDNNGSKEASNNGKYWLTTCEAYSETCQSSKMERFTKVVNG